MVEQTVIVQSKVGLHARPAALFVQTAARFKSRVTLEANGKTANGKSILQVLALGARQGDSLLIRTEGEDEAEALKSLAELVLKGDDATS